MRNSKLSFFQGWLSIIVNTLLFGLKYWAGIVTGSVALIADAWHTLSDSLSSIILIIGVKISGQKADKEHPFGHGRAENIAALVIAFLLGFIALEFIRESVVKFINQQSVEYGMLAIIVTVISILAKEGLAQFAFWAGRKTGSTILKADAWHHRSDALSSLIVLIGIFLAPYFWWMDAFLGILIAVLIIYAAYSIFMDAVNPLLGKSLDNKIINSICEICQQEADFKVQPHHFHIHEYGSHKELTFHIKVPYTEKAEVIQTYRLKIKKEIMQQMNLEATIQVDFADERETNLPPESDIKPAD